MYLFIHHLEQVGSLVPLQTSGNQDYVMQYEIKIMRTHPNSNGLAVEPLYLDQILDPNVDFC